MLFSYLSLYKFCKFNNFLPFKFNVCSVLLYKEYHVLNSFVSFRKKNKSKKTLDKKAPIQP